MTTFATIMDKLKETEDYPLFIRHKNGNTTDNRVENLEQVHIRDAFAHINDWKVDWVCDITEDDRAFLVDMLTPVPEIYHYIRWRAEKEETVFDLPPLFFKNHMHRGVRTYFGANVDDAGTVLGDRDLRLLEEFRARR